MENSACGCCARCRPDQAQGHWWQFPLLIIFFSQTSRFSSLQVHMLPVSHMWFIASNICQWRSQHKISVCPRKSVWKPRYHRNSVLRLQIRVGSVYLCSSVCVCVFFPRTLCDETEMDLGGLAFVLAFWSGCVRRSLSVRSVLIRLLTGQAVSVPDKQTAQLITGRHTHTHAPPWPSLSRSDPQAISMEIELLMLKRPHIN